MSLNGAYYGPPIPPPPPSRRSRDCFGRCCCCLFDCFADSCCCLFGCVFKIIFTILIVVGLIVLIVWLILRPNEIKFYATDATLAKFDLTESSNTLDYDLAVNFKIRNPNRKIGIYYDEIQASGYYEEQRLSTVIVDETFYQGHKNTTEFGPVKFKGSQAVMLDVDAISDYDAQKNAGAFDITVKLRFLVRFKIGAIKIGHYKLKVKCDLELPAKGDDSDTAPFEETRCHYTFHF